MQLIYAILIATLAVLVLAFIILEVFLYALKKIPNAQGDGIADTLRALVLQIQILIVAVALAVANSAAGLANHFITQWKTYVLLSVAAGGAELWVFNHSQMLQTADQGATEFYFPTNKDVILPVFNFGRVLFDTGICWYNFVMSRYRIITNAVGLILLNCGTANWNGMANAILNFFTGFMRMLITFLATGMTGTLNTQYVTVPVADFVVAVEPSLICACSDLTFAYNITARSLSEPSLHGAIENATNAALEAARIPLIFLISLFNGSVTDCASEPTVPLQIQCYQARPPNFYPISTDACGALLQLGTWLDETIFIIFDQFFDLISVQLPQIGPFLSNLLCVVLDLAANILMVIFHIDLVFGVSPSVQVKYLNVIDIDTPLAHGYTAASSGIDDFWYAFKTLYTDDLGCAFSNASMVIVGISEFWTRAILKLYNDPTTFLPFMAAYDFSPVQNHLEEAVNCTESFVSAVNGPLGDAFKYFMFAISDSVNATISAASHVQTADQFKQWLIHNLTFQIDKITDDLQSMSIANGNFFRQFTQSGFCPLKNPADLNAPNPFSTDFFCCTGNFIEAISRLIIELGVLLKDSIVAIIAGTSYVDVLNGPLNLQTDVIPEYEETADAGACLLAALIPTDKCPADADSRQQAVKFLALVAINWTGVPLYFSNVAIGALGIWYNGGSVNQILCYVVVGSYDVSVGNLANTFLGVTTFGSCFIIDNFTTLGIDVWDSFGWNGGANNLRDSLCNIVNALIQAVQFLVAFFNNPASAIYNEIVTLIQNNLIAPIQATIATIQTDISNLKQDVAVLYSDLNIIFNCLTTFFQSGGVMETAMENCFNSCFGGSCSCGISYSCGQLPPLPTQFKRRDAVVPYYGSTGGDTLVFWDQQSGGDPPACVEQYRLFKSAEHNMIARHLMKRDFQSCMQSASAARTIDMYLMRYNASAGPLVDPRITYDPWVGYTTLKNLTYTLFTYLGYRGQKFLSSSSDDWIGFALSKGIRDPLSVRLGMFADVLLSGNANTTGTVFLLPYRAYEIFMKLVSVASNFMRAMHNDPVLVKRYEGRREQMLANLESKRNVPDPSTITFNQTDWNAVNATISFLVDYAMQWRNAGIRTANVRKLKNRVGVQRISRHIMERTVSGYTKYADALEQALPPYKYEDEPGYDVTEAYYSDAGNATTLVERSYIKKRCDPATGKRCITVSLCIENECLNCSLLQFIMEDVVDAICKCLVDAQPGKLIVDQNQFLPLWIEANKQRTGSLPNPFSSGGSSSSSSSTPPAFWSGDNLNSKIVNSADNVLSWLVPSYVGIVSTENSIVSFFTNTNTSDPGSFLFWILFFSPFGCHDYQANSRCEVGPDGLGPYTALKYIFVGSGIFLLIAWLFFSPSLTLFIYIIPLMYIVFVGIAYLMAPVCTLLVPLVPNCIGDDAFGMYMSATNVDCIDWPSLGLPGLTTSPCPTAATDFTRDFPHCEDEPYLFVDGFRNFYYWLQTDPRGLGIYNFISTTEIPLIVSLRDIGLAHSAASFDFGPSGQPNATWNDCQTLTWVPNTLVLVTAAGLGIVLTFYTFPIFLAILSGIGGVIALALVLVMECIASITGVTFDRSQYFSHPDELPKPKPPETPTASAYGTGRTSLYASARRTVRRAWDSLTKSSLVREEERRKKRL